VSFLLDTDTCSAHLRRPAGLMHRFSQYSGRLYIPAIVLGELYAWAYHREDPAPVLEMIQKDLLADIRVLLFDERCAETFGKVRGTPLRQGISVSHLDLLIAAVALTHDFTLVTHNTADFRNIPNLRLDDWLTP
jgi:tRNA(fMet)-specific endonuclease VapC